MTILVAEAAAGGCEAPGLAGPAGMNWMVRGGGSSGEPMLLEINVSGLEAEETPEGCVLRFPGQAAAVEWGAPDVPVAARLFKGFPGTRARVGSVDSRYEDAANWTLAPVASPVQATDDLDAPSTAIERRSDPERYGAPGFWPEELIRVQEAWMGTQKHLRVECRPVQYDPVARILRVHSYIRATVHFDAQTFGTGAE